MSWHLPNDPIKQVLLLSPRFSEECPEVGQSQQADSRAQLSLPPGTLPVLHRSYASPRKFERSWAACLSAKATEDDGKGVNFEVT